MFIHTSMNNTTDMTHARLFLAAIAIMFGSASFGQDTTATVVKQGDPVIQQSPEEMQRSMLQDMVKITSKQIPEGVKEAVSSSDFKGQKTYFKHKKKDEYAVEVKEGEISSIYFFDKMGKELNGQP